MASLADQAFATLSAAYPEAIRMPFLNTIGASAGGGLTASLAKYAICDGGVGQPATGEGTGIFGLNTDAMVKIAVDHMILRLGTVGEATPSILKGLFDGIIAALGQVKLRSISGFGGTPTRVTGLTMENVYEELMTQLEDSRPRVEAELGGKVFFEALSKAIAVHVTQSGKPGPIPAGGTGSGPVVAKVSG